MNAKLTLLACLVFALSVPAFADDVCPNRPRKPAPSPLSEDPALLTKIIQANLSPRAGRTSKSAQDCSLKFYETAPAKYAIASLYPTASGPRRKAVESAVLPTPEGEAFGVNEQTHRLEYRRVGDAQKVIMAFDPSSLKINSVGEENAEEFCQLQ